MSSTEVDFLALVLARRPDLKDLLLKPADVLSNEAGLVLQTTASPAAARPSPIQSPSLPSRPCHALSTQTSPPRKLSIKSHIEGPVLSSAAQLPRPSVQPKNAGASGAAQTNSDTESPGIAALGAPTADEYTSDEDPGGSAVDIDGAVRVPELAYTSTLSGLSGSRVACHNVTSSRRGTHDGVVPGGSRPVTFSGAVSAPIVAPHRFRSNSSPCGIQLSSAEDDEVDVNDDDPDRGGDDVDDGAERYGVYGDAVALGRPGRHLSASPSFRDMAVGWGRHPTLETLAALRLDGVAVRGVSPLVPGSSPHSPVNGSRPGGLRDPHPGSPRAAAFATAAASGAHQRRRVGSQGGSLPAGAVASAVPPPLLLPMCLPRRLARTPDAGFRRRSQIDNVRSCGSLTQIETGPGVEWEDVRAGGVAVPLSPPSGVVGASVGGAPAADPTAPDPRVGNPRALRSCRSSGLQSFLPSSRAKLLAAKLQQLRSQLCRAALAPDPLLLASAADVKEEAGTLAAEEQAGTVAGMASGAAATWKQSHSPLMRMSSSPARMMVLRSPLPFFEGEELDVSEGDVAGGDEWAASSAKDAAEEVPPRRRPPVLPTTRLDAASAGLEMPLQEPGRQHKLVAGESAAASSVQLRCISSTAPGNQGAGAVSVRALSTASAASSAGDLAGVGCQPPQPGDTAAAAAGGSGTRQALQLPVRQPQPPLLPYGGILRLAVSQSSGGLPFAPTHPRGAISVGRQGPQPPPQPPQQQQSRSHWSPSRGATVGGGGAAASGGGGGAVGPPPSTSRGAQVLQSISGGDLSHSKALAALSLHSSPQTGTPTITVVAPPGNVRTPGAGAGASPPHPSPRRPSRCSDSGAAAHMDGGSGGGTPGSAADGLSPHLPLSLADFLVADADGSGGVRLGVLGNCRPTAAATVPPLLPSLKHQKGLRGARGSPGRQRHVLPPPHSGPLVKQEHLKALASSPERLGGGGGGGGGGGTAASSSVAVVLAVADGVGQSPDARHHRHYKLGFAAALAAPAPSASAAVAAAVRHSVEASPARPVGLLPVINHQVSMRPAGKLPTSAPVPVPFPTVTPQQRSSE